MKLFEVTNTTCMRKSANCKAQISTMCGVNDTDLCIAICRFSHAGCVCHLEQLHAQSPFLFPIVFSINIIRDRKRGSASLLCVTFVSSRERERDACDVIDITLKSRVIMHMITSTAR